MSRGLLKSANIRPNDLQWACVLNQADGESTRNLLSRPSLIFEQNISARQDSRYKFYLTLCWMRDIGERGTESSDDGWVKTQVPKVGCGCICVRDTWDRRHSWHRSLQMCLTCRPSAPASCNKDPMAARIPKSGKQRLHRSRVGNSQSMLSQSQYSIPFLSHSLWHASQYESPRLWRITDSQLPRNPLPILH